MPQFIWEFSRQWSFELFGFCLYIQYLNSVLYISPGLYTRVELLGCEEYVHSSSPDNAKWFSLGSFINVYSDTADRQCIGSSDKPHPCQYFLLSDILMFTNLADKKMISVSYQFFHDY